MTDTERGELTAAELDLASGGIYRFYDLLISSVVAPTNGQTTSEGTSNTTVSAMYDITQGKKS